MAGAYFGSSIPLGYSAPLGSSRPLGGFTFGHDPEREDRGIDLLAKVAAGGVALPPGPVDSALLALTLEDLDTTMARLVDLLGPDEARRAVEIVADEHREPSIATQAIGSDPGEIGSEPVRIANHPVQLEGSDHDGALETERLLALLHDVLAMLYPPA